MKLNMKTHLTAFILSMTLIFMAFFVLLFHHDYRSFNTQQFTSEMHSHGTSLIGSFELEALQRKGSAETIVHVLTRMAQTDLFPDRDVLAEWVEDNPHLRAIYFIRGDIPVASSHDIEDRFLKGIPEWYSGAVQQEGIYYTAPYVFRLDGSTVITFSEAFVVDGETVGVVAAVFDPAYFIREIEDIQANENQGYVLLHNGRMIQTDLALPILNRVTAIEEAYVEEIDGYVMSQEIDSMDLEIKLLFLRPEMQIMDETYRIQLLFGGLIYVLLVILMVRTLVIELASPFNHLRLSVLKISREDYDFGQVLFFEGGFESVHEGFVKLGRYLKRNILQLESLRRTLDNRHRELDDKKLELEHQYERVAQSREKIENQLREYEELVDMMSDMIWEFDREGRITRVNHRFIEVLGFQESNLIGYPLHQLLRTELTEERFLNLVLRMDHDNLHLEFVTRAGEIRHFKTKLYRLRNSEGEVVSIQALSINESELEKKAEELELRSRELALLGELSQDVMIQQSLEEIVAAFVERLKIILSIEAITVRLNREGRLESIASFDPHREFVVSSNLPIERSNVGLALKQGKVLVMESPDDLLTEDRFLAEYLSGGGHLVFVPLGTAEDAMGIITIATEKRVTRLNARLVESMAVKVSIAINNRLIFEKLGQNYLNMVNTLNAIIRAKSEMYYQKSRFISSLAKVIGKTMYLKESEISDLGVTGLIADIGIIGIPDDLIEKPKERMTQEERIVFDSHAKLGYEIIAPLGYHETIREAIADHHFCCKSMDLPVTTFSRIICFCNGFADKVSQREWSAEIDWNTILDVIEPEHSCERCREYFHVLGKAASERPEEMADILAWLWEVNDHE